MLLTRQTVMTLFSLLLVLSTPVSMVYDGITYYHDIASPLQQAAQAETPKQAKELINQAVENAHERQREALSFPAFNNNTTKVLKELTALQSDVNLYHDFDQWKNQASIVSVDIGSNCPHLIPAAILSAMGFLSLIAIHWKQPQKNQPQNKLEQLENELGEKATIIPNPIHSFLNDKFEELDKKRKTLDEQSINETERLRKWGNILDTRGVNLNYEELELRKKQNELQELQAKLDADRESNKLYHKRLQDKSYQLHLIDESQTRITKMIQCREDKVTQREQNVALREASVALREEAVAKRESPLKKEEGPSNAKCLPHCAFKTGDRVKIINIGPNYLPHPEHGRQIEDGDEVTVLGIAPYQVDGHDIIYITRDKEGIPQGVYDMRLELVKEGDRLAALLLAGHSTYR